MRRDDEDPMEESASGDVARIERLLGQRFGETDVQVRQFAAGRPVYSVERGDAASWVVRIGRGLERYAAALDVLRRTGHPAAHVVADASGVLLTPFPGGPEDGDRSMLVVTQVPGRRLRLVPDDLAGIGSALGVLHAVGPAAIDAARHPTAGLPALERAGMLPANELAFGLRCLHAVDDQVPATNRDRWNTLVAACTAGIDFGADLEFGAGLNSGARLTTVFLHGDAHPWNSVVDERGHVELIDWDSSGPGPAVIDLAFLVLSCDTGPLIGPVLSPDLRRLEAVVAAYGEHVRLGGIDLAALDDAVAFRALVGVAVGYSALIREGRDPETDAGVQAGLERIALAPSIADRMRSAL